MFYRFILVGMMNTIISMTITFGLFNLFHVNYAISYFFGTAIAVINSFLMNKHFTYKSTTPWRSEIFKFLLGVSLSYLISNFALISCVEILSLNKNIAFLVSMVIYTLVNYTINKRIVFKKGHKHV